MPLGNVSSARLESSTLRASRTVLRIAETPHVIGTPDTAWLAKMAGMVTDARAKVTVGQPDVTKTGGAGTVKEVTAVNCV